MNEYLAAKEGSGYGTLSNRFVDCRNSDNEDELTITLTPIGYLHREGILARNRMNSVSREAKQELIIKHATDNTHDSMAVKVLYEGVEIGFIQKRYSNVDRTELIDGFCFSLNALKEVKLYCENTTFYLQKNSEIDSNHSIDNNEKEAVMSLEHIPQEKKKTVGVDSKELEDKLTDRIEPLSEVPLVKETVAAHVGKKLGLRIKKKAVAERTKELQSEVKKKNESLSEISKSKEKVITYVPEKTGLRIKAKKL